MLVGKSHGTLTHRCAQRRIAQQRGSFAQQCVGVHHARGGTGRQRILADVGEVEGVRSDQHRRADRARFDQVLSAQRQQAATDEGQLLAA